MCCACGGGETNEDESIGFCVDTNIGPDGETLADDWDDDPWAAPSRGPRDRGMGRRDSDPWDDDYYR